MSDNPNVENEDIQFQQLFKRFIHHTSFVDAFETDVDRIATPVHPLAPPSPPPSEPDINQALNEMSLLEMADFVDQDFYTALAKSLDFPTLPMNWKRILYHAYNHLYSSVVVNVPRVHRNTLVAQSIALAKQRCKESNALWAAEEDQSINIGHLQEITSLSRDIFRQKLYSAVGKAEWAFHDHALKAIIYLLISRPGYPALMPHLPGPAGTLFNRDQREIATWYFTWNPTCGHLIWHDYDDDGILWFQGSKARSLLFGALKDEHSTGFFGILEQVQDDTGIWVWQPIKARGASSISIVSYVLASASVSVHADFLQKNPWDKSESCPPRRTAIEEEQSKIYRLLDGIIKLSVPGFSEEYCKRARDGLLELLGYLDYEL